MESTENHDELEQDEPGSLLDDLFPNRIDSLKMSMRRKIILVGFAYFSLLIVAVVIASPAFLRLLGGGTVAVLMPVSSLYLPHVQYAAASPSGELIAVATNCGIEIRSLSDGELLEKLGDERVSRVSWSPDGKMVAGVGRSFRSIAVWRFGQTGAEIMCQVPYPHVEFAWFPDSSRIGTISRDQESLIIWDVQKDRLVRKITAPKRYWICDSFAVSPTTIATAWFSEKEKKAIVALWDAQTYIQIREHEIAKVSIPPGCYAGRQAVYKMAWSPDGNTLSYLVSNCPWTCYEWFTLQLWNLTPGSIGEPISPVLDTEDNGLWISSYSWAPSGNSLAIVFNMSHSLGLYELGSQKLRYVSLEENHGSTGNYNYVTGFTPDGEKIVLALYHQNEVRIYSAETLEPEFELTDYGGMINSVDLSPDKTTLAVLDGSTVKTIDVDTGKVTKLLPVKRNLGGVLRYSDDGNKIHVWTDESVVIWDMEKEDFDVNWSIPETPEEEGDQDGDGIPTGDHHWKVSELSPDNTQIAIIRVGSDRKIRSIEIRDTSTGQLIKFRDIPPITGDMGNRMGGSILKWAHDQQAIGFTDYNQIFTWNIETNDITRIGSHTNISSFTFHPQKQILTSTGRNQETLLWNLSTKKHLAKLDKALYGIIYSPDGSMILGNSGIYNSTTLCPIYTLDAREESLGMIWDKTGRAVVTLTPYSGPINIYNLPELD